MLGGGNPPSPPVMVMVPLPPLWLWCGSMAVVVIGVVEEVEIVIPSDK